MQPKPPHRLRDVSLSPLPPPQRALPADTWFRKAELHVGGDRGEKFLEVAQALLHLNRAANEGHNIDWKKF
jgi:hypothetical protein